MAAAADSARKSGIVPLAIVFVAISGIAVGMGWFIGTQIRSTMEQRLSSRDEAAEKAAVEAQTRLAAAAEEAEAIGRRPGSAKKKQKESAHGAPDASGKEGAEQDAHGTLGLFAGAEGYTRLDPILSTIGTQDGSWIRLEVAVLFDHGAEAASEEEKLAITEAIIGLLRSRTAGDLAGPSGFMHFREDLTDIVMLNTAGRATSAKVLSMVLE